MHSFRDGAWQLDNFELSVNETLRWSDDCESAGSNGWSHDDIPTTDRIGVIFERVFRPDTFHYGCRLPGWWMAALDSITGRTVDGQASWLISPPIDISGADALVGQYDYWKDTIPESGDRRGIWFATADSAHCVTDLQLFEYYFPGEYPAYPMYGTKTEEWDFLCGNDWLAISWRLWNEPPGAYHTTGFMLGRQRVGIPVGEPGVRWEFQGYDRFDDTFCVEEALADTARIEIVAYDDIVSAYVLASDDGGHSWASYPMLREHPYLDYWEAPPPVDQIAPATELRYYFEATDEDGDLYTHPANAPEGYYEFSVLPIQGSVEDPGILLVDKYGRAVPGADGTYGHSSEYYFREALDILGFEYDVFDAATRMGASGYSEWHGPDTSGMKYYDTQIWSTSEFGGHTATRSDQRNLIEWLSVAASGAERNLLLTGNDIGYDLMEGDEETLGFYTEWLASQYVANCAGSVYDTMLLIGDAPGGFDFMTYDDRTCHLHLWDGWYWCGRKNIFDVVQPNPAVGGAEVALEYVTQGMDILPAGVAYTHPGMMYRTVNLGFGIEFMMGSPTSHEGFRSGVSDRVDLMANIMEYFGKEPAGPGTDVGDTGQFTCRLDHARPNPFNPRTTIDYSVATPCRVVLRVYDLSGRLVRTLVDRDVEAGEHKIVWDGTMDDARRAASGVYFVRMEAAGMRENFRDVRKLVLLK
jgi:hypothetical protein